MQVSLLDAVVSLRLSQAGATPPPAGQTGVPGVDPYAPSASTLTQLSGYGQLLNAASQSATALANGPSSTTTTTTAAASTTPAVATATYGAGSPSAIYALNVSQVAKGQTLSSSYVSDPNATVFSAGSLTIQTGTVNGSGVFSVDATSPATVNITTPSLNGIASAINASGAGVSATVVTNSYGSQLQITGTATGAGNAFRITTAGQGGPLDGGQQTLNQLGLTQTQAAQNASYTVNGGAAQTSTTNAVTLDTNVNATLLTAGTTNIVTGNATSIAQNLVTSYNTLQGDITQLTAPTGALNGDTATATQLSTDLQAAATHNYGGSPSSLSQLGITTAAGNTLAFNPTGDPTFNNAYNANPTGVLTLLNQAIQQLSGVVNGYLNPSNSNPANGIQAQQQSIITQYQNSVTSANPSLNSLSANQLNAFIQNEIAQGSNVLGLTGFSTYG